MHSISILRSLCMHPRLLLKNENIFLISHMRGNTSLLSHLLGNHEEIEGYYEMHNGYYSWKSLYRQKLLYLKEHKLKANSHYFFDKILHNEHEIALTILKQSKVIIMLRKPEQTIRSIINLYKKNDPEHPYCQAEKATDYYINRLISIQQQAQQIPQQYYYLQAENLRIETEGELKNLQKFLSLKSSISIEYASMKNTGKEKFGDSSKNITSGKVQKKATDYSSISLEKNLADQAQAVYEKTHNYCQLNSINYRK